MGWLSIIGQLIGLAPSIEKITGQIADYKMKALVAATDQERIHAEERAKELESIRDVQVAESAHTNLNVIARIGFAAPIVIVLWKILVWDQTLGWGTTAALGKDVWNLIYIVAGFYFVQSVAQIIKR